MATSSSINLFRSNTAISPQMATVETQLRKASYLSLAVVLVLGFLVGGTYLLFRAQYANLEKTKGKLIAQLNAESTKQALYVALKDRVTVLDKVLITIRPLASILDRALAISTPPSLMAVTYEEQGRMVIPIKTKTIDEALIIVSTVVAQAKEENILRSPQLQGLTMDKDGSIRMALTFYPTL